MSIIYDLAINTKRAIKTLAVNATDDIAIQASIIYDKWDGNSVSYQEGDRIRYNDVLYKVLHSHVSQSDWTPDKSPSLFARVLIPDENVIPNWEQPDSTNPYMIGDKVKHNGRTWSSDVDNNVWEPGSYGWSEI